MGIIAGFSKSVGGDRKYGVNFFAEYFASFIGNGVFPNPSTGLQVMQSTGMRTVVKAGNAFINGYRIKNDGDYILDHDLADGVLKRIDRIVVRYNHLIRDGEVVIKKGTLSSTPVAPTLQRNSDMYELALADVLITNGATSITQANITDTRFNTALCGIVKGVVDEIDTTDLFAQYNAAFNDFIEQLEEVLDENTAANLLALINGKYTKPETGIPKDDLATAVQTILNKIIDGTTSTKGLVQLEDSVTSTSTSKAATPKSVKQAYDLANGKYAKPANGIPKTDLTTEVQNALNTVSGLDFSNSKTANGYQKLPNGLIIQWGKGRGTFTLPLTFPTEPLIAVASNDVSVSGSTSIQAGVTSISTTQITTTGNGSGSSATTPYWIAIGY